jgi:hypothetical protein
MNYIETLYFIGKCLTLAHEDKNRTEIKQILETDNADWDSIVKVSTAHYVFPALYCNFKEVDYLKFLPKDLSEYMIHIYDLNHERNLEIIKQVQEVNMLFIENNITAIFLKGSGNLIDGLYNNIGERMIADIDLLVSLKDYQKSVELLKKNGYARIEDSIQLTFLNKHYPRIVKKNSICAVEVHSDMLKKPHNYFFNYSKVFKNIKKTNLNVFVLSYKDQIIYNCFNKQINDKAQWYKNNSLRNSYDIFLLSKKESVVKTLQEFRYHFNYLNNYLASSSLLFNKTESLNFYKNIHTKKFLTAEKLYLVNPRIKKINKLWYDIFFYFKVIITIFIHSLFDKNIRKTILRRLRTSN